jgi:hypothetical protein
MRFGRVDGVRVGLIGNIRVLRHDVSHTSCSGKSRRVLIAVLACTQLSAPMIDLAYSANALALSAVYSSNLSYEKPDGTFRVRNIVNAWSYCGLRQATMLSNLITKRDNRYIENTSY